MKTNTSRKAGFTLVEIMIVVAIIGLLAAIAIPNFVRARETSQKNACINNLRQIDSAKQQWALENHAKGTDAPDYPAIKAYLKNQIVCPAQNGTNATFAKSYTINTVNTNPVCITTGVTNHVLPDTTAN